MWPAPPNEFETPELEEVCCGRTELTETISGYVLLEATRHKYLRSGSFSLISRFFRSRADNLEPEVFSRPTAYYYVAAGGVVGSGSWSSQHLLARGRKRPKLYRPTCALPLMTSSISLFLHFSQTSNKVDTARPWKKRMITEQPEKSPRQRSV